MFGEMRLQKRVELVEGFKKETNATGQLGKK